VRADVAATSGPPPDAQLVARIRRWRDQTARAHNVPAYIVINNGAMDELARAQPKSVEELLGIKGIGPAKVRQYGEALLQLVAAPGAEADARPTDDSGLQSAPEPQDETPPETFEPAAPTPPESAESGQPSHYWTWRLLAAGFTPEECAAIRLLSREVVLDHALRAADSGLEIDAAWFLTPQLVSQIRRVTGDTAPGRIRPLLEKLPRGTRYEDVQLVVKSKCASKTG
jgi:ATP-dependent DNA helicase RecQ